MAKITKLRTSRAKQQNPGEIRAILRVIKIWPQNIDIQRFTKDAGFLKCYFSPGIIRFFFLTGRNNRLDYNMVLKTTYTNNKKHITSCGYFTEENMTQIAMFRHLFSDGLCLASRKEQLIILARSHGWAVEIYEKKELKEYH